MSMYHVGKRILISGLSAPSTATLRTEFAKSREASAAVVDLNSSDNLEEINTKINSAIGSLDGKVNLFVVDARTNQLDHEVATLSQRWTLSQVRSFRQIQTQNSKAHDTKTSIVIVGHQSSFSELDQAIQGLARDASSSDQLSSIVFLDLEPWGETSAKSIVAAIGLLTTVTLNERVVSMNTLSSMLKSEADAVASSGPSTQICRPISRKPKVKIALSFDFDALSGYLGTGDHPDNNMSDYSAGMFAGRIGARRLLRMLQKYRLTDKVTWFIPGHTMETFEPTVKEVIQSGAEIGLHGYAHEGAYQMTPEQEREVLVKCMDVSQRLTGKRVQGYRAPMYQLRETTVQLLKEFGFLYDSSLGHHDSQPYFTPSGPPIKRIDFSQPASSWMHPTPLAPMNTPVGHPLVEIPTGWHNEDMMAMQYFPHLHNSQGHVDSRVVEQRWKDIFLWLWENSDLESEDGSFVFPLLMHPDTCGMAHAIAMADRFVGWLRNWGDSVQFDTYASIAQDWLNKRK